MNGIVQKSWFLNKTIFATASIASLFLWTACAPELPVHLNKEDKTLIDSLYKLASPNLQLEADSICKLETKKIIDSAVDSIMQARLEERKKRLGY